MEIIECTSLEQVRENIDKIDEQIVKLVSLRKNYVDQAAKYKNNVNEVKAPDRVKRVIDKVKKIADKNNVDPNLIEGIYTMMIDHFINMETDKFSSINKTDNL